MASAVRPAIMADNCLTTPAKSLSFPLSHWIESLVIYGRITKPATRLITLVGIKIAPNSAWYLSAIFPSIAYLAAEKI